MVGEYVVDCILAVFGAPVSSLTNEDNAVNAGLAMLEALDEFNREHTVPAVGEPFHVGIGINRGEVIAGNIGSLKKMKYGVIGDPVNVASRVQSQTRDDASDLLITADVKAWLDDGFRFEELGPVELRGKSAALELFRVLAAG